MNNAKLYASSAMKMAGYGSSWRKAAATGGSESLKKWPMILSIMSANDNDINDGINSISNDNVAKIWYLHNESNDKQWPIHQPHAAAQILCSWIKPQHQPALWNPSSWKQRKLAASNLVWLAEMKRGNINSKILINERSNDY